MKQIVTNAKLYVCGIERELYTVSLEYERNTSNSGRPADEYIGGYIELSFPSQASDDVLLEWIIAMRLDDDSLTYPFNIYVLKNGKIVFYEDAACTIPLFIYKFSDATLVNYKEVFNSQTGMVTSLKISAAIEEYKSIFRVKLWNENFIPPVINGKPNQAFHEKKTEIITAYFKDAITNKRIKHIKPNKEVLLSINTKNMIGKTVDIDLSNYKHLFEYKGKKLEKSILEKVYIAQNTQTILLKTIKNN